MGMDIKSNKTESFLNVTYRWPFAGGRQLLGSSVMCHWLENSSTVEGGEVLALSRNLDTGCRCAVHRAPAGVLKVSRNFQQNDLLLMILPQAEA